MTASQCSPPSAERLCLPSLFFFLLFAFLLSYASAEDQTAYGTLRGRLLTKGVKEPVPYARIREKALGLETSTDKEGRFHFERIPVGERTLTYVRDSGDEESLKVAVKEGEVAEVSWYVRAEDLNMEEVVVTGKKTSEGMTQYSMSKSELESIPGNNNDPIRAVENFPGVTSYGMFGQSEGLIIRGTSADDSSYRVNGFEIPQLFHFGILTSVVNPELIDSIDYFPGAYGVKYGDAMGGIIEVKTRPPRSDRFGGVVDLATYSSFAMFEGPAGEGLSMAGAVRRSFIDFILPYVIPSDQAELTLVPRFYDYQAAIDYKLNSRNSVSALFFGSDDGMELMRSSDDDKHFEGGSTMKMKNYFHRGDLKWVTCPTDGFSNSLAFSLLYSGRVQSFGNMAEMDNSTLTPAVRDEALLKIGRWNELQFGFDARVEKTEISSEMDRPPKEGLTGGGRESGNDLRFELNENFSPWIAGAFVSDIMKPFSWIQILPGFRLDYHSYLDELSYDPRLNVDFFIDKNATFKTAVGLFHQWPAQDEMIENIGTKNLKPEKSFLTAAGFDYDFGSGWSIDTQGYYKNLSDLVTSTETGASEPYANSGIGYVYGAEFLGRKKLTDRFFGWVSYTYSVSKRKDNADAAWRYFDDDQTHNFIVLASYRLGQEKLWKVGAKWQYVTGTPYTEITGSTFDADSNRYTPIYSGDVNGARVKDYHQLDIRVDKLWVFNRWTLNTYLDVQNVYWNKNPMGYRYNFDYSEKEAVSFQAFMPSIGAQARF